MTARTVLLMLSPGRLASTAVNLFLWGRLRRDAEALAIWSEYFDAGGYLQRYPDVARARIDPRTHFLLRGNQEYRNPSARFDMHYYLGRNPEVTARGVNALLHYALFGKAENRTLNSTTAEHECEQQAVADPSLPVRFINNEWLADCPLVSVVIPCFNYGRYLEEAIRSILEQTFQNFEIIVIEGGSTDDSTIGEVRRLEAQGLPKTRFYYREGRHFAGDNRNFGIGLARGRYVCCLDADDMLRPVYIEVAVFLAEVYGFDVVSPSLQSFGDSELRWLVPDPSFPGILTENQIATAALFRRSAWAHAGGFRDWGLGREHVCEDWDFWIRLLGHGFQGKAIREPLLMYRVHNTSITITSKPDMTDQRQRLCAANALMASSFREDSVRRSVLNPYTNLEPGDRRPGFLLALPFITIGGAENLLRTIGESIEAHGERLIVITSLTLSETIPGNESSFDAVTPHVYHLSRLFDDDEKRREFFNYLIRRYNIRTMMLAGCEFAYHLLPNLASEFPYVVVVDQLFNDAIHVFNNRYYSDYIDATVVPSEQLAESLVNGHGADPSEVHVIPHGIKIPLETKRDRSVLPPSSEGKVIIGFFGRLAPEKAPDLFVEIARKLAHERNLYFVMTGEGPEQEKVLSLIRNYGLQDRIYTPGFVSEVQHLMRAADIVVLPSRIDGMPLAVLEAQAMGKPVVASRVGSLPAMIKHGETGFLCDSENIDAFYRHILTLVRDRDLCERMGAAGRNAVSQTYSAERMLEAYRRLFDSVRHNPRASHASYGIA